MGLQLIFVVEANKKSKSDWIYIKETIDKLFIVDSARVKLNVVYLNGKGNYNKKEKEISLLESQYQSTSKTNSSKVIVCLDCDEYDLNPADKDFLQKAKKYCSDKGFELVWFCKDIERVYIGKKVPDIEKKDEAAKFKAKKLMGAVDKRKLSAITYVCNTSNIYKILEKYLDKR